MTQPKIFFLFLTIYILFSSCENQQGSELRQARKEKQLVEWEAKWEEEKIEEREFERVYDLEKKIIEEQKQEEVNNLEQGFEFTASTGGIKKAGVTDRFQITYAVNKRGQFMLPKYKNFKVIGSIGQGTNNNVVREQMGTSLKTTYSYEVVLQPIKLGTHKIERAKIKVDNAIYESQTVTIEVVKESQSRQQQTVKNSFEPGLQLGQKMIRGVNDCDQYRYYNKIKICLPILEGMTECYSNKRVKERANQGRFRGNTILGIYLKNKDYSNLKNEPASNLKNDGYYKIYGTKQAQGIEFGEKEFNALIKVMGGVDVFGNWDEMKEELSLKLNDISFGKPVQIDQYKPHKKIISTVYLLKVALSEENEKVLALSMNIANIKNTLIYYCYCKDYVGPETLDKVKAESDLFGFKLLEINK